MRSHEDIKASKADGRRVLRWSVPVDDDWHQIGGGEVLHVAVRRHGVVEAWTLETSRGGHPTTEALAIPTVRYRMVRVYGTGHPIHPRDSVFHGTALEGSGLVWHLFGGD